MRGWTVRTTITIDDSLFQQAQAVAEPDVDTAELVREAIRTYVRVQSARRLAALGGKAPKMAAAPRQRGAQK